MATKDYPIPFSYPKPTQLTGSLAGSGNKLLVRPAYKSKSASMHKNSFRASLLVVVEVGEK